MRRMVTRPVGTPSPRPGAPTLPEDQAARIRLEQTISLEVQAQPLEKVLQFISERSKVPIHVQWNALKAAGIQPSTPVTANLQMLPVRRAVWSILEEFGEKASLGYTIEDGAITLSTRDDLNSTQSYVS